MSVNLSSPGSHSAQRCHCPRRLSMIPSSAATLSEPGSNNKRLTNVSTDEFVAILSVCQPLAVAASRKHPLLNCVTVLCINFLPLLSAFDSISTSWLHACRCSCISTRATVDCIPERYRQNQDSTQHCTTRFPLGNNLSSLFHFCVAFSYLNCAILGFTPYFGLHWYLRSYCSSEPHCAYSQLNSTILLFMTLLLCDTYIVWYIRYQALSSFSIGLL